MLLKAGPLRVFGRGWLFSFCVLLLRRIEAMRLPTDTDDGFHPVLVRSSYTRTKVYRCISCISDCGAGHSRRMAEPIILSCAASSERLLIGKELHDPGTLPGRSVGCMFACRVVGTPERVSCRDFSSCRSSCRAGSAARPLL
jgi:hypothetical protein